jgi:hypothetical protein
MRSGRGTLGVICVLTLACGQQSASPQAGTACPVPVISLEGVPDTISPVGRCAMGTLARARLAGLQPNEAPPFRAGDTALLISARVFDFPEVRSETREPVPWRVAELDVRGRPRLLVVREDRRTGRVEVGQVHR